MWYYSQYPNLCPLWSPQKLPTQRMCYQLLEIDYLIEKLNQGDNWRHIQTSSLSSNSLKAKISLPFTRQWNPYNQPFSCRTNTYIKDGFSVHSKIFAINDVRQIIALVSYIMGSTISKLF